MIKKYFNRELKPFFSKEGASGSAFLFVGLLAPIFGLFRIILKEVFHVDLNFISLTFLFINLTLLFFFMFNQNFSRRILIYAIQSLNSRTVQVLLLTFLYLEQILLIHQAIAFVIVASFSYLAFTSLVENYLGLYLCIQILLCLGIIYFKTRRLILNVPAFEKAGFKAGPRSFDFQGILTGLHSVLLKRLRTEAPLAPGDSSSRESYVKAGGPLSVARLKPCQPPRIQVRGNPVLPFFPPSLRREMSTRAAFLAGFKSLTENINTSAAAAISASAATILGAGLCFSIEDRRLKQEALFKEKEFERDEKKLELEKQKMEMQERHHQELMNMRRAEHELAAAKQRASAEIQQAPLASTDQTSLVNQSQRVSNQVLPPIARDNSAVSNNLPIDASDQLGPRCALEQNQYAAVINEIGKWLMSFVDLF